MDLSKGEDVVFSRLSRCQTSATPSEDSFSDYNDPLNNSDFIKNLSARKRDSVFSRPERKRGENGGGAINGRTAVGVVIIKTANYET